MAGGNGTGATSITTDEGCTARLKSGETNVYVISVYPLAKTGYSVTVGKAGDAGYEAASEQTVTGTTMGANQTVLSVAGWSENVHSGDSFDIKLSGGSGTGAISFDPSGCKVAPSSGGLNDTFTVTVTARENEAVYAQDQPCRRRKLRRNVHSAVRQRQALRKGHNGNAA